MPSAKRGLLWATGLSAALLLLGYYCVALDRATLGSAIFIAVPFVASLTIGVLVNNIKHIALCGLSGCLFALSILFGMGLEGILCALMAAPLAAAAMIVAELLVYVLKFMFKKDEFNSGKHLTILLLLSPLLIAAVDKAEEPQRTTPAVQTISSATLVEAPIGQVWQARGRFVSMEGPLPCLLQPGALPVPNRCTLDRPGVGGVRTCYFDKGTITQRVTEWEQPSRMSFEVTGDTLPGNHWLTFSTAGYTLAEVAVKTRVTRHTTIESQLWPRWYWAPIERLGVRSEHDFVLRSLTQKLRLAKRLAKPKP